MASDVSEVAIVGAGPAGIAAAVYLKRAGVEPLLLERGPVGGLLVNANLVENYPGFPEGIAGRELVALLEAHLRRWRVHVTKAAVDRVEKGRGVFRLSASRGVFRSRSVVVATGTRPKDIALAGADRLMGRAVFHEISELPVDPAGKAFLVIGGGDIAFDYALNLAGGGGLVDVVFKSREPKCLPLLRKRARRAAGIRLHPETVPERVEDARGKVLLRCRQRRREVLLFGDFALIACGREPNLDLVARGLLDARGRSRDPGLFVVGDAGRGLHRQVGIAVGDGIAAAMTIVERRCGGKR